ncbi:MAG TPA: hypothetical protein VLA89_19340 [Gemmatimonadales bacterium]|nr:hypothetical protein [Gemmatimonadales bacterium]
MVDICQTCKWFVEDQTRKLDTGELIGWCRRYPPTTTKEKRQVGYDERGPIYQTAEITVYPTVQSTWSCGEWLSASRKVHQDLIRPTASYGFTPAPTPAAPEEPKPEDETK